MCLIKDHYGFKTAEKDIKVYKRLVSNSNIDKTLFSGPYYDFNYEIGKIYETELREHPTSNLNLGYWDVEEGFHAYTSFEKASIARISNEIIFECTIPKGSLYARSLTHTQIVSNKIKLDKIICA